MVRIRIELDCQGRVFVDGAMGVGPKRWAQTSGSAYELVIRSPLRTSGPPAGRARFLVARAPCRARFSPISVHGPAGFMAVSVHDQARRGRPDFVRWRPCSNGGLYTGCSLHCTNPRWNRPSSAQSPGRRFRAPRAAAGCPARCLPTQSAEAPLFGTRGARLKLFLLKRFNFHSSW